jgi:hypothetical protein
VQLISVGRVVPFTFGLSTRRTSLGWHALWRNCLCNALRLSSRSSVFDCERFVGVLAVSPLEVVFHKHRQLCR